MSIVTALVGATGLVGSNILKALVADPNISEIHAFSRKELPSTSPKVKPIQTKDSSTWASQYPPSASVFFSALGTTRAQVSSFEAQRKIDYDLNLELAKAAHAAGAKTYVIISSAGVSTTSPMPYGKMKAELDEAVKEIGFEQCIVLRPGLLLGVRGDRRPAEWVIRQVAGGMKALSSKLTDFWAQDAEVVARAAVVAATKAARGEVKEKYWLVDQSEIVRMGRTEWKQEVEAKT